MQHLALAAHRATPATDRQTRTALVPQLKKIADQLVADIRAGRLHQARRLAHRQQLPPIAWGFLASCMQRQNIPGDVIEGVLS